MIPSIFSVFKYAIGPSSSHTTGALFCGADIAKRIPQIKPDAERIDIILMGSFAHTGEGHLTDKAAVCGLAGYDIETESRNVTEYYQEIMESGLLNIEGIMLPLSQENIHHDKDAETPRHPNTLRFVISSREDSIAAEYLSVGGGLIRGPFIDGKDESEPEVEPGGGKSHDNVFAGHSCMDHVMDYCNENEITLAQYAFMNEAENHGIPRDEAKSRLNDIWLAMNRAIAEGVKGEGMLPGPLGLSRRAKQMHIAYIESMGKWRILSEEMTLAEPQQAQQPEHRHEMSLVVSA